MSEIEIRTTTARSSKGEACPCGTDGLSPAGTTLC